MSATYIKLIGDRGETLGYVNRETGECLWQEEAPGKVVQEFGSERTKAMNAQREAKKKTRAVPTTPVETVVAAITENVQLTGRAKRVLDDEEV